MSFRGRLSLFFTIIVVVPMVAVALVLFSLTADSETGKADARLAAGMRTALAVYRRDRDRAAGELDRVASDPALGRALAARDAARAKARLRALAAANPSIKGLAVFGRDGRPLAATGSPDAVAAATANLQTGGRKVGALAVSITQARSYVNDVALLTGLEARVLRNGRVLASTLREQRKAAARSGHVHIGRRDYRGRFQVAKEGVGPPVQIGVFMNESALSDAVASNRALIGGVLLAFLLLSLASSVFVVRALQGQVDQFLQAARRLGRGDFSTAVPVQGSDEFAALGTEFNKMSEQLAAKIEEVERKRRELEEAIRNVGEAFAAGLDREGIVELAVRTAVQACDADVGRAVPVDERRMQPAASGGGSPAVLSALEGVERKAYAGDGSEPPGADGSGKRQLLRAESDGAHAVAVPLRARFGGEDLQFLGVLSIAREGEPFSAAECDLLAYLAGQATVSLENASLHETVQRQAVTDELTGLYNVRHFHQTLDSEIERARRFTSEVGLVMLDIDDFKQVNDTYGHLQGDLVLREVAKVLHNISREIDEPARYGGEEMAVVLPQTALDGAEQSGERMRAAIEGLRIRRLGGGEDLRITASFGVASLPASAGDKGALIAAADAALYRAKRAGKNRVERAEHAPAAR